MKMKVVYNDGSWIIGKRYFHWLYGETLGTHHFIVLDSSGELKHLIGKKIAVVIAQVQYFILELK